MEKQGGEGNEMHTLVGSWWLTYPMAAGHGGKQQGLRGSLLNFWESLSPLKCRVAKAASSVPQQGVTGGNPPTAGSSWWESSL